MYTVEKCEYFSLGESIDLSTFGHYRIFIQNELSEAEDMLELIPHYDRTQGTNIFEAVNKYHTTGNKINVAV